VGNIERLSDWSSLEMSDGEAGGKTAMTNPHLGQGRLCSKGTCGSACRQRCFFAHVAVASAICLMFAEFGSHCDRISRGHLTIGEVEDGRVHHVATNAQIDRISHFYLRAFSLKPERQRTSQRGEPERLSFRSNILGATEQPLVLSHQSDDTAQVLAFRH
jgi:hypothetical protein